MSNMTPSALIRGIVLWCLSTCAGVAVAASPANLFPNPDFARFDGDLPKGWTLDSWNQPMMKVRPGKLSPGRDGTGQCLEVQAGNPASIASLSSPSLRILPDRDYLLKGHYSSTCELVTRRERWLNAEGVTFVGNWLDAGGKTLGSFAEVERARRLSGAVEAVELHIHEQGHRVDAAAARTFLERCLARPEAG